MVRAGVSVHGETSLVLIDMSVCINSDTYIQTVQGLFVRKDVTRLFQV